MKENKVSEKLKDAATTPLKMKDLVVAALEDLKGMDIQVLKP